MCHACPYSGSRDALLSVVAIRVRNESWVYRLADAPKPSAQTDEIPY